MWNDSDARKVQAAWDSYLKWSEGSTRLHGPERQKAIRFFLKREGVLQKYLTITDSTPVLYVDVRQAIEGNLCLHCQERFAGGHCISLCCYCKTQLSYEERKAYRIQKYADTCRQRYGVDNLFQRTDLVKAGYQRKYGSEVDNPMDVPSIRKKATRHRNLPEVVALANKKARRTCLRKYGASHYMKSAQGLEEFKSKMRARFGVDNVMHTKQGRANYDRAVKKFLSDKDRVHRAKERAKDTNLRRYGVSNPMLHPDVQERHKEGLKRGFAKFGGHPMYDDDIKRRANNSKYKVKTRRIQGVNYEFQGWEDVVIRKLIARFGHEGVCTQFTHDFKSRPIEGWTNKGGSLSKHTPDLYVPSKKCYIEVKSPYTLLNWVRRNRSIQDSWNNKGRKLLFVVTNRHHTVTLPPNEWTSWSFSKLNRFLATALESRLPRAYQRQQQ